MNVLSQRLHKKIKTFRDLTIIYFVLYYKGKRRVALANGYKLFARLHPPGGLYRYKGGSYSAAPADSKTWKNGKAYLLIKWGRPKGISAKSPILNAFFLVGGQERCVDIGFFRYLEQVE